jgi:hypothetical protein
MVSRGKRDGKKSEGGTHLVVLRESGGKVVSLVRLVGEKSRVRSLCIDVEEKTVELAKLLLRQTCTEGEEDTHLIPAVQELMNLNPVLLPNLLREVFQPGGEARMGTV